MSRADRLFQEGPLSPAGRSRSGRNVSITLVGQLLKFGIQTAASITLARLLTPDDFGVVAMVSVVANFVATFKGAGLAQATIQRAHITRDQVSALFWIDAAIALGLAAVMAGASPIVAWLYHDRRLVAVSIALAVPVVLAGGTMQHIALLQRSLRFGALAACDVAATTMGLGLGIVLALHGAHYWSLVSAQVMTAVTSLALIWSTTRWRPRLRVFHAPVRDMLGFGAHVSGSNILGYLARNADNFIVGRFLGSEALGQYSQAYRLMVLPLSLFAGPVGTVLTPTLCRLRTEPEAFRSVFLRYVRLASWLTIVPLVLLSDFGGTLVAHVLGSKWAPAGVTFEILAFACVFQPVTSLVATLFVVIGRTRAMLQWGGVSSVVIVASFVVGIRAGQNGVAFGYALAAVGLALPCWRFATMEAPVGVMDILHCVKWPAALALLFQGVFLFAKVI